MRRPILAGVTGIALMASMAPMAHAQTVAERAAVRCVLALSLVAQDPKNAAAAAQGTYYFMGRLAASGALARVQPLLIEEAKKLKDRETVGKELTRCSAELNASTGAMRAGMDGLRAVAAPATTAAPATPPAK